MPRWQTTRVACSELSSAWYRVLPSVSRGLVCENTPRARLANTNLSRLQTRKALFALCLFAGIRRGEKSHLPRWLNNALRASDFLLPMADDYRRYKEACFFAESRGGVFREGQPLRLWSAKRVTHYAYALALGRDWKEVCAALAEQRAACTYIPSVHLPRICRRCWRLASRNRGGSAYSAMFNLLGCVSAKRVAHYAYSLALVAGQ